MKIGNLYMFYRNGFCNFEVVQRWQNKLAVYLGEDDGLIFYANGHKIINHKFLVEGNVQLVDKTFLELMKEIKTNV